MAEAVAGNPPKPDYGQDAPVVVKRMFTRGAWAIGVAILMYAVNHEQYPEVSASILTVLGIIGAIFWGQGAFMIWSSRVAKLALRDRLLDSVQFKGDEKVLDVGCGRGLLLIGAAKRLKSGKATGIDIWNQADQSGNSADATRQNAKIEGVSDRVRIENGDARKLVYPDNHYDVVVSTLAIHNISEKSRTRNSDSGDVAGPETRRSPADLRYLPHGRLREGLAGARRDGRHAIGAGVSMVHPVAEFAGEEVDEKLCGGRE